MTEQESTQQPDVSMDLPPEELRRLGHEVIELTIEAIAAEREEPVLRAITGPDLRSLLDEPLPEGPTSPDAVLEAWRSRLIPFCRRNGHPRFFGYVVTSADPLGVLADTMASAVNQPVTAWRSAPAATEIERLAVRWLDELVGFGAGGTGVLTSGGSAANFHGMACALMRAESRAELPEGHRHRLVVYMSREGHVSMRKAAQVLGVPRSQVRLLDVDDRRRLRIEEVHASIVEDRERGLVPAVVCPSAGTANTGAIDPLVGIADVCEQEDVWLHIDGSYGAPAALTPSYAWMSEAFARADSLSLDPHKWLFAPADAGCILIRDDEAARRPFTLYSEYTAVTQTDPIERHAMFDYGLEMSRRFRGLKVWSILKARGKAGIRAAVEHDLVLTRHLNERIEHSPRLQSLGSELSISCFRYLPEDAYLSDLNAVNRAILETVVSEGRCYMSPTELDGAYALRTCIVNFRTCQEDVDFLLDEVLRIGEEVSAG